MATFDREPSSGGGGGDSWSAAVVALHYADVRRSGPNGINDAVPAPTPIGSSGESSAKPSPAPCVVPGERGSNSTGNGHGSSADPPPSASKGEVPFRARATTGDGENKRSSHHQKAARQAWNVNSVYIQHEVLPTDTLQGLCLAYKISATRLRMENKFSGNSLQLAPKTLKIPIDPEKIKKMPLRRLEEAKAAQNDKKSGLEEEEEKRASPSKEGEGVASPFIDINFMEKGGEGEVPWMIRPTSSAAVEESKEEVYSVAPPDLETSKRLLQDSIDALSHQLNDHGRPVLTGSERAFLQQLLESNGPGVAKACSVACERLMDEDLFWTTSGGGWGSSSRPALINIQQGPGEAAMGSGPGLGLDHVGSTMTQGAESEVYSCVSDLLSVGTSIQVMEGPEPLQFLPQHDKSLNMSFSNSCGDENEGKGEGVVAGGNSDEKGGSSKDLKTPVMAPAAVAEEIIPQYNQSLKISSDMSGDGNKGAEGGILASAESRSGARGNGYQNKEGGDCCDSTNAVAPSAVPLAVEETPAAAHNDCKTSNNKYLDSSTKERLDRLEQRRRQPDRLLRAHEAGIVVTAEGSARRSLARMGLPMEGGPYGAKPPPGTPLSPNHVESQSKSQSECSTEEEEKQAVDDILCTLSDAVKFEGGSSVIEQATYEKALAKMDERALRRIRKEEEKEKKCNNVWSKKTESAVARPSHVGCTGFSLQGMLRRHFASRQFSVQRENSAGSSYTRFDSFLLTYETETMESDGLLAQCDGGGSDEDGDSLLDITLNTGFLDDSLKYQERASDSDRLTNLLVNAGFRDAKTYDTTDTLVKDAPPRTGATDLLLSDARPEDDEDILSFSARSTNSVAVLMRGGPSYRNVDVFRGGDGDAEDEEEKNVTAVDAKDNAPSFPAVAALKDEENPSDDDASDADASIPSLHSDLGELPSLLPPLPPVDRLSQSARPPRSSTRVQRRATIGIMKSSSDKNTNKKYKRSVSWNRRVFAKEEAKEVARAAAMDLKRQDSASSLSVISFPNLATALPIVRSDSIALETMESVLSHAPSLAHANSVHSPPMSPPSADLPLLCRAHSIQSDFGTTATDNLKEGSLNSDERVESNLSRTNGAAWESPLVSAVKKVKKQPPLSDGNSNLKGEEEVVHVFIHPTSKTRIYEGAGMEIEDFPQAAVVVPSIETMDGHYERYQNMISVFDDSIRSARSARSAGRFFDDSLRPSWSLAQRLDDSVRSARTHNDHWENRFLRDESMRSSSGRRLSLSGRSRRSFSSRNNAPPIISSLDDSFVIRNINFARHSSEILRSLSNDDLTSSHYLETRDGATSRRGKTKEGDSWDDFESNSSFPVPSANAWPALQDEYVEDYGASDGLPFRILGTSAADKDCHPHVLSHPMMESLQSFLPPAVSSNNFWLKYSLVRDGPSLPSLLQQIRGAKHTIIAIETVGGEVFGSFTSLPWRKNWRHSANLSGEEEAFLWRMRWTRSAKDGKLSVLDQARLESKLDVYNWSGRCNEQAQYCTGEMLVVGGGEAPQDEDDNGDNERDLNPQNPDTGRRYALAVNKELLRGTSSACASFESPPLSTCHADGSLFEILNLEVWTMTPCSNVADAGHLEMRNFFLDG